jgi:diguanylate cyclase (GGDEF)-like protein
MADEHHVEPSSPRPATAPATPRRRAADAGAEPADLPPPPPSAQRLVGEEPGETAAATLGAVLLAGLAVADASRTALAGGDAGWWLGTAVVAVVAAVVLVGHRPGRLPTWAAVVGSVGAAVAAVALCDADPWIVTWHALVASAWLGSATTRGTVAAVGVAQGLALAGAAALAGAGGAVVASAALATGVGVLLGVGVAAVSAARRAGVDRRLSGMATLLGAADVLAALQHPDQAARVVATLARDVLGADAALVALRPSRRTHGTAPVVVAQVGWPGYEEEGLRTLGDTAVLGVAASVIRADDVVRVSGAELYGDDAPFTAIVALPLRGADGILGAVCVGHRSPDAAIDHRVELPADLVPVVAGAFARQAGIAFERVRSLQRVVDASLRDPLTGLANRRALEAVLAQLGPGDAVVLVDLDHFKSVNDTHGHTEGDRQLVAFAMFLRLMVRAADTVGRWGGEEFLVVLRGTGDQTAPFLDRLQQAWHEREPVVTFSAGVSLASPTTPAQQVLDEADAALYRAKRLGRDRICFDERSLVPGAPTTITPTPTPTPA